MIVYVAEGQTPEIPAAVAGVRTVVVPTNTHAVATGAAPSFVSLSDMQALPTAVLSHAVELKEQITRKLMPGNAAIFGVGVGQSLDNPREADLVVYVDRKQIPADLQQTIEGLRIRYVFMDRFHVTRSYAVPFPSRSRCSLPARRAGTPADGRLLP